MTVILRLTQYRFFCITPYGVAQGVIGTTALALLVLVHAVVFEHGSDIAFLESYPAWLIRALAALVAIFSGWRRAKDPIFKAGLLAKSIGKA